MANFFLVSHIGVKLEARAIAKLLRDEHPDYNYLKSVFQHLRTKLYQVRMITYNKNLRTSLRLGAFA
ncbi:hypothetical protein [Geminocystis sp. GBBB08]|uniref:hypothetical protein n=1 Tax=Geminocystis sp. GBBB08 TaxID=2604140 RepID=UPI0027E38D2F|nr:hypothetical protein [Geminocystis sp. GBBB08]MBL1208600.1 hypothetical protein [Geminocystis sp. GBBB08]